MKPTVFLDLDDTILDFKKAERIAVKDTLARLGLPATDEVAARYSVINDAQWKLLERGELTRPQVLTRRFQLLFEELGVTGDPEETWHLYEKLVARGHYFMPGAEDLLKALFGRCTLCVASNGTASVQDSRIKSAGIAPYFRAIFVSQRLGAEKPTPAFFDACFAALPESRREESIIIGDSLTSDIRGGQNAGIRTCWYNFRHLPAREDIRPDYEVTSLDEIPALIDRIFGK